MKSTQLAILIAATGLVYAPSVRAQVQATTREPVRLITVSGQAELRRKPDQVSLSLGVEERGADVAGPRQRAAQKAQAALRALLALGVNEADIQTSNYSISRQWEQDPNERVMPNVNPKGRWVFVVSNTVTVRTPMVEKAGDLFDAVVKAGFNNVSGPYFELKNDEPARMEALEAATKNARAKADAIARGAGVRISSLETINESGSYSPPPMPYAMASRGMADQANEASTPVQSGMITITANVSASFRF